RPGPPYHRVHQAEARRPALHRCQPECVRPDRRRHILRPRQAGSADCGTDRLGGRRQRRTPARWRDDAQRLGLAERPPRSVGRHGAGGRRVTSPDGIEQAKPVRAPAGSQPPRAFRPMRPSPAPSDIVIEATAIQEEVITELRKSSYADLQRFFETALREVTGSSGRLYHVEILSFWDE